LRRCRQLTDLVEEQCTAEASTNFSDMALGGAGERALLVAEQDRLHEVLRHGAAIDRDERFCLPLARSRGIGARDQLFADAGFTRDEDRKW